MYRKTLVFFLLFVFMGGIALAAPLFPDVPDNHWARDAVADLAAKGILEGYPDGTFKGDRASTRWEMAIALQRLLAKMEAKHATFATKADLEALRALTNNLKDELDALGVRVKNLEEHVFSLDKRVTELERITFEGDFKANFTGIGIRNTGRTGTTWDSDVGGIGGVDFTRGHKFGTIDLFNGRNFTNGTGITTRARLGVKVKLNKDMSAGIRLAGYASYGDAYINAYWGVPAPYLSNAFAGNSFGGPQGMNNAPWTRMNFDQFVLKHHPTKMEFTAGAVERTNFDNFILAKTPNPNVHGKSMAKFEERIVTDRKKEEVKTLRYFEDEETYLPFWGLQLKGPCKIFSDMKWEVLYAKMPFGANPTAGVGQPATNDVSIPFITAVNGKWNLKDQGYVKLNFAYAGEKTRSVNPIGVIPNHGNYWFWTDPQSWAGTAANARPMRGNAFVSKQEQFSYGGSVFYRFRPSYIRAIIAYGGAKYRPNRNSGYSVTGNHFRAGVGWTNPANTLSMDLEYISTDPYYDAFQLYFQPAGAMRLGGVPPGTPIAFAVVPSYFGGFPGSYAPFGYQLHDSGLYPNNRDGIRFAATYRFAKDRGSADFRMALLEQHQATVPHRTTTGLIRGMKPGFIDPVFHPLRTNGAVVFETPKGEQQHFGGGLKYKLSKKFKASAQYDHFQFNRSTAYLANTATAKRNFVDLKYTVTKIGLEYKMRKNFTIRGGYNLGTVRGYHPAINTLIGANAGVDLVNLHQHAPYLGFEYDLNKNTSWNLNARYLDARDKVTTDAISPESFKGFQVTSTFQLKF